MLSGPSRPAAPATWRTLAIALTGLLLPLLWPGVFRNLLDTRDFTMTHMDAGWPPMLTVLHVGADALIGVSYTFIAGILCYIVFQHRRLLPFDWVVLAFGLFIVACGTTHFMHVLVLYLPAYWLDGYLRGVTAVVSVATAIALPPLVPRIAQLLAAEQRVSTKQAELERLNQDLQVIAWRAEMLAVLGEALQTAATSEEVQRVALEQVSSSC